MDDEYLREQVRALRTKGLNPKQVARALGIPPAVAARVIRAIAAADAARVPDPADRELRQCWVSARWSTGLAVDGHPEWRDGSEREPGHQGSVVDGHPEWRDGSEPEPDHQGSVVDGHPEWRDGSEPEPGHSGLVAVLIARDAGRSRLSVCGYLVDVYCLGVKNVVGPLEMSAGQCAEFTRRFFGAFDEPPLAAPLDLAQHLVYGAVDFARSLGFEPAADFADVKAHLGSWCGPSSIGFGRYGQPFYVEGPYDDANHILRQLQRGAVRDNFHYLVEV